jgi:hypothetical protein
VDDTGRIVREVKVASEPEALLQVLKNPAYRFKRIGLEAGLLSQWLFSGNSAVASRCQLCANRVTSAAANSILIWSPHPRGRAGLAKEAEGRFTRSLSTRCH